MISEETLVERLFTQHQLVKGVFSSPLNRQEIAKIIVKPVQVKDKIYFQWTYLSKTQAFHHNYSLQECSDLFRKELKNYKQSLWHTTTHQYHVLCNKKGGINILAKPASSSLPVFGHNKEKNYILKEGEAIPYLVELGIMNACGKVYPGKMDKFKQINRFLEFIKDVLKEMDLHPLPLKIIDFGCGKAYLTFALYDYLHRVEGLKIDVLGLDLKKDVIEKCQNLAEKLSYEHLRFVKGSIESHTEGKVDLVVCLHACDTATDAALAKAVLWKSQAILAVPCCQHEVLEQMNSVENKLLLKHGILKERMAALVTDASRAELLECSGYRTQIIEFIDLEHTPKNLLIKAIKRKKDSKKSVEDYFKFKQLWNIKISLEDKLPFIFN